MEIIIRESHNVGLFVEVNFNEASIDMGLLNYNEAIELAETLRDAADELDPPMEEL